MAYGGRAGISIGELLRGRGSKRFVDEVVDKAELDAKRLSKQHAPMMPAPLLQNMIENVTGHWINITHQTTSSILQKLYGHGVVDTGDLDLERSLVDTYGQDVVMDSYKGRVSLLKGDYTEYQPYINSYVMKEPWQVVINVLKDLDSSGGKVVYSTDTVKMFLTTITGTLLTSGCELGQIGRLKSCRAEAVHSAQFKGTRLDVQVAMANLAVSQGCVDFTEFLLDPVKPNMKVNAGSSAGDIWLQLTGKRMKRRDTLLTDMVYAEEVFAFLMSKPDERLLQAFLDNVKSTAVTWLKAKYECVEREKYTTKTRNIMVYSSYLMAPLGCFLTYVMSKLPHDPTNPHCADGYNRGLAGFSPMYRGLHGVIQSMITDPSDDWFSIRFYSDNLYVLDRQGFVFYSADVPKMEATSQVSDGVAAAELLLKVVGAPTDDAFAMYVKHMMGEISHNRFCLMRNYLLEVLGLASGSAATFCINHIRASSQCHNFETILRGVGPDGVAQMAIGQDITDGRLPYRMELTTKSSTEENNGVQYFSIGRAMKVCKPVAEQYPPVVRLDMLGFDGAVYEIDGVPFFCACLNIDRLTRAITYRKRLYERDFTGNAAVTGVVNTLVDLATLMTLYIVGGYAYPETHLMCTWVADRLIKSLSFSTMEVIKDSGSKLPEALASAFENMSAEYGLDFEGRDLLPAVLKLLGRITGDATGDAIAPEQRYDFINGFFDPSAAVMAYHYGAPVSKGQATNRKRTRDDDNQGGSGHRRRVELDV